VPDEEKKYQRAMFVTTSENTTMVAVGIYELKGSATEGEYWKCMAQMMLHPKDAYEMAARFSWCAIQRRSERLTRHNAVHPCEDRT
jgi:hypothetical protein